jgi:hypothetical protein
MGELYFYVGKHLGGQLFLGVVRSKSIDLNIQYNNDEPIQAKIININPNDASSLVGEVILLAIKTTSPMTGSLKCVVKYEATKMLIIV